jgi:soluble lytic murein transglycosylase
MRYWLYILLVVCAGLGSRSSAYAAPDVSELEAMLREADAARINGNYPLAIKTYRELAQAGGDTSDALPLVRSAWYRLAQTYVLDRKPADAIETWQRFVAEYPDDPRRAYAWLQLGNLQMEQKNFAAALLAYQAYRLRAPQADVLAPYVSLTLGQAYAENGQQLLATTELRSVLNAPDLMNTTRTTVYHLLGDVLLKASDVAGARQAYEAGMQEAQTATARSRLGVAIGRALKQNDKQDEAIAYFKRVLTEATSGEGAPQAVEELVALGVKDFNFYQAGMAYYARRRWADALVWLRRSLNEQTISENAYYYAAKAYEFNRQHDLAIRAWTQMLEAFPDVEKAMEARYERADDYHRLGNDGTAFKLWRDLAATYPQSKWAEESLFAIAVAYDDFGKYTDAAKQYEATQATFPNGARASEALARAGVARIRQNDWNGAKVVLEKAVSAYPQGASRARAYYWLGKVAQQQGRAADARALWLNAYRANPMDFYGLRGRDLAQNSVPVGIERANAKYTLPTTFAGERRRMESWLREWAAPEDPMEGRRPFYSLSDLSDDIASSVAWQRMRLLCEVNLRAECKAELRALLARTNDPVTLYQLALALRDIGFYDLSLQTAYRVYTASPQRNLQDTPELLQRLVYPTPYAPLVVSEAQKNGFDPMLYYGLIWQESQFDPGGLSFAFAYGLTQVIPSTGQGIAAELKRPNFQVSDLYKPYVSLEFGAYYYGKTYKFLDKDFMMALAGYNGGPGNGAKWKNADPDFSIENIDLSETRTYVRRVYQHYWFYRALYAKD